MLSMNIIKWSNVMGTTIAVTRETFQCDALVGTFEGWTAGKVWNGFACPYFEFEVAEQVLKASETNGYYSVYDPQADSFLVSDHMDVKAGDVGVEYRAVPGVDIDTGRKLTLYAVGAFDWTWSCPSWYDDKALDPDAQIRALQMEVAAKARQIQDLERQIWHLRHPASEA